MDGRSNPLYIQPIKLKHMTTFETAIQNLQIVLAVIVYFGATLIMLNSILPSKRKIFR
jgi:hypothetical protein